MVIQCPLCSAELIYTVFYRSLVIVIGLVMAWGVAEALRIHDAMLSFTFFVSVFPSLIVANRLLAVVASPRYKKRDNTVISLLHR